MNGNPNASRAQSKYGITTGPDFSAFEQDKGKEITVNPHSAQTNTTMGKTMAWRSEGPNYQGPGTFIDFGQQPRPQGS